MNRKGVNALEIVVGVVLGLLVIAIFAYIYGTTTGTWLNFYKCEGNGVCKSACADGTERRAWQSWAPKNGCTTGQVCCAAIGGGSGGSGPGGTVVAADPTKQLQRASVRMQLNGKPTGNIEIVPDIAEHFVIQAVTTVDYIQEDKLVQLFPDSASRPNPVVAKDYSTVFILRDETGKAIETLSVDSEGNGGTGTQTGIMKYAETDAKPEAQRSRGDSNVIVNIRKSYNITLDKAKLIPYVNQQLMLDVRKEVKNEKLRDDLEGSASIGIKIVPPFQVSTLKTTYEKSKQVRVTCDKIACNDVLVQIVSGKYDQNKVINPCVVPANDAAARSPVTLTSSYIYVLYDYSTPLPTQYYTIDECKAAMATRLSQDADYASLSNVLSQSILRDMNPNQQMQIGMLQQFGTMDQRGERYRCEEEPARKSDTAETLYYSVKDKLDPKTGVATFTLDSAKMTNKYLCVYTRDALGQYYQDYRPQRILIDREPPTLEVDFNPWTLTVTFICIDAPGRSSNDPVNLPYNSGCGKISTYYIKDVTKFLPALFSGPQSAEKWCPSVDNAGSYATEVQTQMFYNSPEVRVLCVRAEDKVGNAVITKRIVYNGYATLAAAIAASQT